MSTTTLTLIVSILAILGFVIDIDTSTFVVVVAAVFTLFCISVFVIFHLIYTKMKHVRNQMRFYYDDTLNLNSETCRCLMDAIPSAILIYEPNGDCMFCNSACRTMFNINDDDTVANLFKSKIITLENQEKIQAGNNLHDIAFLNYTDETSMIFGKTTIDKKVISYDIQVLHNIYGDISNYILAISDISKEYEQKQHAEEYMMLLRDCMQLSDITAYVYDVDKDKYLRLKDFEIIPTRLTADDVFRHIAPKHRAQYIEMFLRMKNGEITTDRRRYPMYYSVTGSYYYVETFSFGVTDVSGRVVRIMQTIRNVTDNQEKISELESIKLIQSKALPIAGIISWRYNIDTHIFVNAIIGNNKTMTLDESVNRMHPEDRQKFLTLFHKLEQGAIESMHVTVRKINPNSVHEIYAIPMLSDGNEISEILGITCNVSDKYTTEYHLDSVVTKVQAVVSATKCWIFDYNCTTNKLSTINWKSFGEHDASVETFIKLIHPEQVSMFRETFGKVQRQEIDRFNMRLKIYSNTDNVYRDIEFAGKAYEYLHNLPTKIIAYAKYI